MSGSAGDGSMQPGDGSDGIEGSSTRDSAVSLPGNGSAGAQVTTTISQGASRNNSNRHGDLNAYNKHAYRGEFSIRDRISFMPLIIGAFEGASRSSNDCFITMPLSRFRLPEVNFAEAKWNRKTWRDTNRVRNALSKLGLNPFDAMFSSKHTESGADFGSSCEMTPFVNTLESMRAIERKMIECLKENKGNIAQCAANLRFCVVDVIKEQITYMTKEKEQVKETRHRLSSMLRSAFRGRYSHYERLPFLNKDYQNNEVFNGNDYYKTFFKILMTPSATLDAKTKEKYIDLATRQETNSIDVATGNMRRIIDEYDKLGDELKKGTFLMKAMSSFGGKKLYNAGSTEGPAMTSISYGALRMEYQRLVGVFLWELLLERAEILRSNVFSFFSIVTHYTGHDEGKVFPRSATGAGQREESLSDAAEMTDRFMESAIAACFGCLFVDLCSPVDIETMTLDRDAQLNFLEITSHFRQIKNDFESGMENFFRGMKVPPFDDAMPDTKALRLSLKKSIFSSEFPCIYMNRSINITQLGIRNTLEIVKNSWRHLYLARSHVMDRGIVSGNAEDHPLKYYSNQARNIISKALRSLIDTKDSDDRVYDAVRLIIHATYFTDGAFMALYVFDTNKLTSGELPWSVRRYYRGISNPISISTEGIVADSSATSVSGPQSTSSSRRATASPAYVRPPVWVFDGTGQSRPEEGDNLIKPELKRRFLESHPFRPETKKKTQAAHTEKKTSNSHAANSTTGNQGSGKAKQVSGENTAAAANSSKSKKKGNK